MKTTFIPQQAIISTPPQTVETNYIKLYRKADGCWYELDDSGIERSIVCPKYIEITQSSHGITMLGTNSNVFVPGHIDDTTGLIVTSNSSDAENEAFGLIEVVDNNTLRYHTTDALMVAVNHGYQVGAILYLQDDGTLNTTVGTLSQKIYEVLTPNLLHYLKQPMWSASSSVTSGLARIQIPSQTLTNIGSIWNTLTLGASDFDTIGLNVTSGAIEVPSDGIYSIKLIANVFDNNSARIAHRTEVRKNGGDLHSSGASVIEGNNYMRDATAHDSAHLSFEDLAVLNANDTLTIRNQTTSSVANTTDITSGWLIIKKEA